MENNNSTFNKHELYQKSVQNTKKEIGFFKKTYRMIFNKIPLAFREDFCGTGLLSCDWVKENVSNIAVGIDIDVETLEWGIKNNIENLPSGSDRIKLLNHNVLEEFDKNQKFDIICSLNYSHFLLRKRKELLKYFQNVRNNIKKGIFILDFYGGSHVYDDHKFSKAENETYRFEGSKINILNNTSKCSLNYKIKKNKYMPLFEYNFRYYTILELKEALEECGFQTFKLLIKEINEDDDDQYSEYQEMDIESEYFPESDRYTGYLISIIS